MQEHQLRIVNRRGRAEGFGVARGRLEGPLHLKQPADPRARVLRNLGRDAGAMYCRYGSIELSVRCTVRFES